MAGVKNRRVFTFGRRLISRNEVKMQKWEYLELEVEIGGPITKTSEHLWWFKPDGKHFENHGTHGVLMAKLGLEGWELVTGSARILTGLTSNHKINYIFKRPIIDNTNA